MDNPIDKIKSALKPKKSYESIMSVFTTAKEDLSDLMAREEDEIQKQQQLAQDAVELANAAIERQEQAAISYDKISKLLA